MQLADKWQVASGKCRYVVRLQCFFNSILTKQRSSIMLYFRFLAKKTEHCLNCVYAILHGGWLLHGSLSINSDDGYSDCMRIGVRAFSYTSFDAFLLWMVVRTSSIWFFEWNIDGHAAIRSLLLMCVDSVANGRIAGCLQSMFAS